MPKQERFLELDLLRTLAIVLMVAYHVAYDLHVFHGWEINVFSGGWWLLARSAAALFLLLVGISFVISSQRRTPEQIWQRALQRGLIVLGWGLVITIGTYIHEPATYIRFGILHCIGVSLLLLPLFRDSAYNAALLGLLTISAGLYATETAVPYPWLIPLGLTPADFTTLDYFPLLPWFGVVMLGVSIGKFFYENREPRLLIANSQLPILTWPGRHALLIYLVHQPVILATLAVTM